MSMLTPPGMGGQYRITGDKYPRMRRPRGRRRFALGLVASVAALGLIGWGTLQLIDVFTGGGSKATAAGPKADCATKVSPSPTATKASGALPKPGQITVNVLNATPRSGLAKQAADELRKRGFRIGDVGNAPKDYDKKIPGTGVVLGAKSAAEAALPVLGTQLAGAQVKTDTRRSATEVDLLIGTTYTALTNKKDADQALAALAGPAPAPSSSPKSC
ncbi:LytR C-terminal domain-containing protein [Streptomyces sp. ME02-8801-2C]|uniref:LytR C-terminal domain-containing protein n=1 Tax=Streptomyces sp. ME02-8801-2C TaxID=3028680 RepID=UPI0029ABC356|nr:LytR C-terminal domain-containing protein [Streptomyces sp. ME02-8801-2C]MDX3458098.1 LytR C-terminal domain-containing protein [Streptomyces sp. ME02-8801-2C]